MISSLLRVAEVLQLPGQEDKDPQRVVAAVPHWLISHGHWLLIWDNVEDLDACAYSLLSQPPETRTISLHRAVS